MNKLLQRLNEPFPDSSGWKASIKDALWAGLIVAAVIYLIQPLGVRYLFREWGALTISLSFGAISVLAAVLFDFIIEYVFKVKKDQPSWNLKWWIFNVLILIIFIAIGNFIFLNILLDWQVFNWQSMGGMAISTFLIGLFPISISGLMIQIKAQKRNKQQAHQIQSSLPTTEASTETVSLSSQNGKQQQEFDLATLYYVEAMQNYTAIHYLAEGKYRKELIRNTISNIEAQLKTTSLIRCHRSYLVNLRLIDKVDGNAQGLRLQLKELKEVEVPVSRKYISILKKSL